jgi:phosphate-selective porin OprO/OprP
MKSIRFWLMFALLALPTLQTLQTLQNAAWAQDGFSLRSADGNYQLRLRGYTQLDGRFFLDDEERPGVDTFVLRRVRPIFDGTVGKLFEFRIMPDFGGGTTVLQDAYIDVRFTPAVRLRTGKFKAPVGLERLQSGTDIMFVERAFPTSLVPNRDLGVQLFGDFGGTAGGAGAVATYAVGVFNGVPDGGSGDLDNNDGKDVAARVFFTPFARGAGAFKNLGFGIAGSVGDQEGTLTATGLPTFRTPGQQTFFSYRTDGTAPNTVIADGDRTRISPQGYFYRGPFGLLAEYVTSAQEVRRGDVAEELEHEAWQVSGSWVLGGGGEPSFRAVNPKKPFDPANPAGNAWGAFEIVARYHAIDFDDDSFPLFASPTSAATAADAWAVGLNWYFTRNYRIYLDYERTSFDGGSTAGDREDESIVFTRFQISF